MRDDVGVVVASQRVNVYARNTTTPIVAFDDTDANGDWAIGPGEAGDAAFTAAEDRLAYDVELRNGADRIWWNADDEVQAKTLQLWNADADEYALSVTRTEDAASVEVAYFEGDRVTATDGDLAYISLRLSDSAGNQDEQARISWAATTVADGATQDGDLILSALVNGSMTEMLRLDGSAGTVTISAPISAQVEVADDILFTLGNDNDGVLLNRSTILATNTALTGVMIGTPVTPAVAANSVIVSNVTASGDYILALNVGGNSQAWQWVDSSAGTQTLYAAGVARVLLNSTGGSFTGTWSDLGTVTTADINGGTLDGTVIGGASAAAATVTTLGATGLITATGGQIAFPATQAASAGANTLDDYEEGTFTPGLTFGGAAAGMTFAVQTGAYTKVGDIVHVNLFVVLSAKGSSTGSALITGLPFTIENVADTEPAAAIRLNTVTFANAFQARGNTNATTLALEEVTEAGVLTALAATDFADTSSVMIQISYRV